jgi:hypothetical protein
VYATPVGTDPSAPPADASRPSTSKKHFHDGFYLRMGIGVGYLSAAGTEQDQSSSTYGSHGVTIPVEFSLGGTPAPGVVIGGGSWAVHVPAATNVTGRGDATTEADADYGAISMLGPFIDIFPSPTGGFHIQAAPCLTLVSVGNSDNVPSDVSGAGFGFMGGLGYEGWVSDQWGLGILGRVQIMSLEVAPPNADDEDAVDYVGIAPSLLMTATFH